MLFLIAAAIIFCVALTTALWWPKVRASAAATGSVAVLIPARNEEHNIGACLQTVLAGSPHVSEILVYDDHSEDGTRTAIEAAARQDSRVRLVRPEPLPAGWCGKNFACAQLAAAAQSEWLLFLDADTRLARGAVAGIQRTAAERGLAFLSCWPGLDLVNFSERALMPTLNFVVFSIFPALLSLRRNDASLGIAHGACILVRRDSYERLGGHTSVKNEIFEDTRLAQWWRQNGERSLCLDGQDVVRVRMYASFSEIWCGFRKNFFPAFRHEAMFWLFLLFHFTVFLLPFLLGYWMAGTLLLLARFVLAVRFSHDWWSVFTHPFAEALLIVLGLSSWWHCRIGRGVAWKGRVYLPGRGAQV